MLPPARFQGNAAPGPVSTGAWGRGGRFDRGSGGSGRPGCLLCRQRRVERSRYQLGVHGESCGARGGPSYLPACRGLPRGALRAGGAEHMSRPVPVIPRGSSGRAGTSGPSCPGEVRSPGPRREGRVSGCALGEGWEERLGRCRFQSPGAGQKTLWCPLATGRGHHGDRSRGNGRDVRSSPSPTAPQSGVPAKGRCTEPAFVS